MENKQRTPLALLEEWIRVKYKLGQFSVIDLMDKIESLKPKEIEIINNAFLDGYCNNDLNIDSNNYCQETLTQE